MKKSLKIFWIAVGMLCFALGTVGVVLPILPTVPFYMGAALCFAKGSERLHDWFLGTTLYKKHLESFAEQKAMTMKSKLTVMITVTALMAFGFVMMKNVPIGRAVLAAVWVFHILYFTFRIKTLNSKEESNV